ncbi:MAG: sugar-binding protein [Clostridiaceae bacterium]
MKKNRNGVFYGITIIMMILGMIIIYQDFATVDNDNIELKPKIVLIAHVYTNPYWEYVKQGALKAAEERGVTIDFQGPQASSKTENVKLLNMAIYAKASGIITYVQEEENSLPYINEGIEKGIPIITIDSDAENSERYVYVGTDNIKAGRIAAKELIEQMGTYGTVGIVMAGLDTKNQVERVKSFEDYLNSNSHIKIAGTKSSESYLLEAEYVTKELLNEHPNINILYCTSALDGIGAAKALEYLKLEGKVHIFCFDDLPETLEYIKNGVIDATIVQKPYDMGYESVNVLVDILEGHKIRGTRLTDVSIINKKNVDNYKVENGEKDEEEK